MKIKRYSDFLNETIFRLKPLKYNKLNEIEISYDVSNNMQHIFSEELEEYVDDLVGQLNLKNAHIIMHDKVFSIKGKTGDFYYTPSIDIDIYQEGNFTLSKDPGTYLKIPKVLFNNIDVEFLIKKHLLDKGYMEEGEQINVMSPSMFPLQIIFDFIKLPKDQRDNYLKSLDSINKFNL